MLSLVWAVGSSWAGAHLQSSWARRPSLGRGPSPWETSRQSQSVGAACSKLTSTGKEGGHDKGQYPAQCTGPGESEQVCVHPSLHVCAWVRSHHGPASRAAPATGSVPIHWLWTQASVHPQVTASVRTTLAQLCLTCSVLPLMLSCLPAHHLSAAARPQQEGSSSWAQQARSQAGGRRGGH